MRSRKLIVIPGLNNTGKTTQILKIIEEYNHGKIVIFDKQNEPLYKVFPEMPLKAIPYQKSGVYRVFSSNWKLVVESLNKDFRDGLIVLEDASSYLPKLEYQPLMDMFVSRRHRHIDLILTFHSLNRIPPYVLENLDYLILFKTNDNLSNVVKDSIPRPDTVKFYFDRIESSMNQYEFEVMDLTGLNVKKS